MIGGVHRWTVDCNWKLPAENQAGDIYHADYTHAAVFELMGAAAAQAEGDMSRLMPNGVQVTTDSGHFFVVDRVEEGADERRKYPGFEGLNGADEVVDWYASVQPAVEARLGPAKSRVRPGRARSFRTSRSCPESSPSAFPIPSAPSAPSCGHGPSSP